MLGNLYAHPVGNTTHTFFFLREKWSFGLLSYIQIVSTKTTSMEDVSTGVLEKIKNI